MSAGYRKYEQELDVTGLDVLLPISQTSKFEKLNPTIGVSVMTVEEDNKTFFPARVSPFREREHHVNMLLLSDPETGKSHYTLIRTCQPF